MAYLMAILFPPLGLLIAGRPFQAMLNALLWASCIGWPIASLWAILVIQDDNADRRADRTARRVRRCR